MSTTVTYNGVSYSIPAVGDSAWGTSVTSYLTALATGSLTKAGGAFTLTADANFGTTYGLVAKYFKSQTANIATTGVVRLANTEGVTWRNAANSADLALAVSSGNLLQFNGVTIPTLSSATFADNVFRISGSSDATKLAAFEVDGFTTATTRTFTLPNYDATLATIAGSETLTNKTLTSPTLTNPALGTPSSGNLASCTALPIVGGTTGTLSVARGGTGVTTSTGTGDVVLSTSPTLITPALGTPTSGNLASCTALPIVGGTTGTLSIARGGTGQTTAQAALDALLPTQTSNSGKVLGTNGTTSSWVAGLTSTLTSAHLFVGNGSNVATDVAVTGDVTIDNTGATAIGATKVTGAMLAGTLSGAKIWNDVQTFKYSSGSATAGTYDTNGSWTLTNTSSSTLTLVKSGGASMSIWADAVGTNSKVLIQNSSGTLQFITNGGSTVLAAMSQSGTGQWTFGDTTLIGGATAKGTNIVGRQDQTSITAAVGAGYVGEYLESSQTTQVTMSTGTTTEIGAAANGSSPQGITLTPGVWDIQGSAHFVVGGSTTVTSLQTFIGTATGNSSTGRDLNRNFSALFYSSAGTTTLGSNDPTLQTPVWRVAITSSTTYYLKAASVFGTSTLTVQGTIRATRVA